MRRTAFTLVELLVVIAIIGILIGLLLPAINAARESGRRVSCTNNMRQMSLACINFNESYGHFPEGMTLPKGVTNPNSTTQFGPNWVIKVLPFTEYNGLYKQFDFSKDVSSPGSQANVTARAATVSTMLCPSDAFHNMAPYIPGGAYGGMGNKPWGRGNYAANCSIDWLDQGGTQYALGAGSPGWKNKSTRGVMGCNVGLAPKDVTDGLSSTCLIGELRAGICAVDHRGTWALGACGGSTLWGHGACGDAGPNALDPNGPDDVLEGTDILAQWGGSDANWLTDPTMMVWGGSTSWQAGVKSMHTGGANIAMCDNSVHFISNNIASNTNNANSCAAGPPNMWVWEFLMASGDGHVIPNGTW